MPLLPRITLETVDFETPAASATSRIVGCARRPVTSAPGQALHVGEIPLLDRRHRSQIVPAHRDPVLLQDGPARELPESPVSEHAGQVDLALAERAEEALGPSVL